MTKIITSPEKFNDNKNKNILLFLGGPIKGSENWQTDICQDLNGYDNLIITNPRRKSSQNFNFNEQVEWETEYLNLSDIIVFWIPKEHEVVEGRLYGQTTRFEIGEWIAKNKKTIIIGIDDNFPMKKYIKNRLENDYKIKVYDTYNEVLKETKKEIEKLKNNKPTIYFTSDTHFGSERTLELSKRPFISVKDMDNNLILNWNSVVKPNDEVFHLGDFGDYSILNKLNGTIYLILGNYEIDEMNKSKKDFKEFKKDLIKKGFKNVYEDYTLLSNSDSQIIFLEDFNPDIDTNLFLTHEPLNANRKMFTLFGHIHGRQLVKKYGLDVGVDGHHFKPISIKDVLFFKTAIEKFYDDNVFE